MPERGSPTNRQTGRPLDGLLLGVLWLMHVLSNLWWWHQDTLPPAWDQSIHLTYSLVYYGLFRLDWGTALVGVCTVSHYYPPLTHLGALPFFALFGPSGAQLPGFDPADVACLANLLFLAVLLGATYGLGRLAFGRTAGLAAAALVSFYPLVFVLSREFLTDFPLTALTALTFYLLLRSEGFRQRKYALLGGLSYGLTLLTKWSFFFLSLLALLYLLASSLSRSPATTEPRRIRLNAAWAIVGAMAVAGPWYFTDLPAIVREVRVSNTTAALDRDPACFTAEYFTYYLRAGVEHQLFWPFALLFLFGVGWLICRGRSSTLLNWAGENRVAVRVLGLWLVGGWAALTLVWNKDPRFSLPLLPAVAVFSVGWLSTLRRAHQVALGTVLGLVAIVQYWGVSYGLPFLPPRVEVLGLPLYAQSCHLSHPPRREVWPVREIVARLGRERGWVGPVGILPNCPRFNARTFRYYAYLETLPQFPQVQPQVEPIAQDRVVSLEDLGEFDVLVFKTGDQGEHAWFIEATQGELAAQEEVFRERFHLAQRWNLPDGSEAQVYYAAGNGS